MTQDRYDLDFTIGETPGDVWADGLEDRFDALSVDVTNSVGSFNDLPAPADVQQSENGQWPVFVVTDIPLVVRVTNETEQIIGGLGSESQRLPKQWMEAVDTNTFEADSANVTGTTTTEALEAEEGFTESVADDPTAIPNRSWVDDNVGDDTADVFSYSVEFEGNIEDEPDNELVFNDFSFGAKIILGEVREDLYLQVADENESYITHVRDLDGNTESLTQDFLYIAKDLSGSRNTGGVVTILPSLSSRPGFRGDLADIGGDSKNLTNGVLDDSIEPDRIRLFNENGNAEGHVRVLMPEEEW